MKFELLIRLCLPTGFVRNTIIKILQDRFIVWHPRRILRLRVVLLEGLSRGITETGSKRKKIVIDETLVAGTSNFTNFPVLVSVTDNDLRSTASGGNVQQTDGLEILFTGSDGTTKLDHEIESYTASSGALVAWVEVPTLDYDDDTELYIYYNIDAGSLDEQDVTGTWNSDYLGVWPYERRSFDDV